MASIQTLYSGSSGNCTVIRDDNTVILVDMGKSCRLTLKALGELGIGAKDISAVFVTHEHSDHIAGLHTFLKYYDKPLYGSPVTLEYLRHNFLIPECETVNIAPGEYISIGDIVVSGFRTSHDSMNCYGYRFNFKNGKSIAIATDLGKIDEDFVEILTGCDFIGIEANYDNDMLRDGSYPQYLKLRIASDFGHLSNELCSKTIVKLAQQGTSKFLLMHLSKENNSADFAVTTVSSQLENYGLEQCEIFVAPRNEPSILLEI